MDLPRPIAGALVEHSHDGLHLHVRPVFHPLQLPRPNGWLLGSVLVSVPASVLWLGTTLLVALGVSVVGGDAAGEVTLILVGTLLSVPACLAVLVPFVVGLAKLGPVPSGGVRLEVGTRRLRVREDGGPWLVDAPLSAVRGVHAFGDGLTFETEGGAIRVPVRDRSQATLEALAAFVDEARRTAVPVGGAHTDVPAELQRLRAGTEGVRVA